MSIPVVTLLWVDNNGAIARTQFRPGVANNYAGALARALSIASAMQAVSLATLMRVQIELELTIPSAPAPSPDSDTRRAAILIYRDGDNAASLRVPSPPLLLAETSGLYAGVRISRERLAVLALLSNVEALSTGLVDPLGRPYGTAFTVGGIT